MAPKKRKENDNLKELIEKRTSQSLMWGYPDVGSSSNIWTALFYDINSAKIYAGAFDKLNGGSA